MTKRRSTRGLHALTPRVQALTPTLRTVPRPSGRESGLYNSYRWKKERAAFLVVNPLCEKCDQSGRVTAATIVDHRIPHRGDPILFWDRRNWAPICAHHHSSDKQREERSGGP